jgi:hypothetical protein
MRRSIGSTARVPTQPRCRRLGCRAPLLHQGCGDPEVGHGYVHLGGRVGLLETCQCRTQVGLRAIERRQPCFFELKTEVVGARRYCLALLLRPPLAAIRVGLDPMCLLGIRHANSQWVARRNH